ncbi:MAG: hypothetical protein SGPRY_000960 [Prymnesium sp.]
MPLPRSAQLAIGVCGIFFSFSYFAVLQEDVYKKTYGGEYFKYTFLALVCERGVNAAIGLLGMLLMGGSGLIIPKRDVFVSGISQLLAMAGSNEALRYVSYPTQVLGKSCKLVPVMAGGLVLGGRSFSALESSERMGHVHIPSLTPGQVLLLTVGVCVFNLFGKKKKSGGQDSALGLALIGFSLLMDAVTGGLQDKVKKRTKELNPDAGEKPNFIYYLITQFGPLELTAVTTTRKIFTTLYSVFRNPANRLTNIQWVGCGLAGMLLDVAASACKPSKHSKPPPTAPAKEGEHEKQGLLSEQEDS